MTVGPARFRSLIRGSAVIALAMGVMNLSTYGFTVIAARLLGPSEYGALAAVMGLLLVVNVASLGLQATGARRVSADPGDLERIEADVLAATYKSAAGLGLLCLAAVPLVTWGLRLDSWLVAAMIAVTAVPLTLMGGLAGILQGERRWAPLAGVYLAMGLGRLVFGAAAMVVERDSLGAMTGVAVGAVLPVVVGSLALRRRREAATSGHGSSRRVLRELVHNSHALLAFFALSNADVVVARIVLDEHHSGLYAGGLILAKAVLFLPQFVVVVAFPSMSAAGARFAMTLKALVMVLVIGSIAILGAWVFPGVAVTFIGGRAYAELTGIIWAFAAVGTLLAMIQLLVYNVVARQGKGAALVLWAALGVLFLVAPTVSSVSYLLTAVVVVESVLLALLVTVGIRTRGVPEVFRTG